MSTKIIRPVSVGSYNNWPLYAGSTKQAALSDSDDGTGVSGADWGPNGDQSARDAPSPRQSYVLAAAGLAGAVIDSVTIYLRANAYDEDPPGGTNNVNLYHAFVRGSGIDVDSGELIGVTGWDDLGAALARPGGGSWLAEDLEALEAGHWYSWHHGSGSLPNDAAVADLWAEIAYHYPSEQGGGGALIWF